MTAAAALVAFAAQAVPGVVELPLWQTVGVTEMIGYDDYGSGGETGPPEILTLADAKTVTAWAKSHHIAELSFWALARDNGGCPGTAGSDDCSGVTQTKWAFTDIMGRFGGQFAG